MIRFLSHFLMERGKAKAMVPIYVSIIIAYCNPSFAGDLFQTPILYNVNDYAMYVAMDDLNGDGKKDMIVGKYYGSISVSLGNGDGTFGGMTNFSIPIDCRSIVLKDFNNDGMTDIAALAYSHDALTILVGHGDGTFTRISDMNTGNVMQLSIISEDFNNDGNADLAIGNGSGVKLLAGNGDGTFTMQDLISLTWNRLNNVVAADVNADGNMDILLANRNDFGRGPYLLLGNGDLSFQVVNLYDRFPTGASAVNSDIVTEDFNGDGKLDIVALSNIYGQTITLLAGNGDGTFQAGVEVNRAFGDSNDVKTADLNCDGNMDIIAGLNAYSAGRIDVSLGNGDGTFSAVDRYSSGGSSLYEMVPEDLNNDGFIDLAVTNVYTKTVSIMLNSGIACTSDITANAGSDQIVEQTSPEGAEVILDGAGSTGENLAYEWTWPGGSATGINPQVVLPAGKTTVTLTISNGSSTSDDTVLITVEDTVCPSGYSIINGTMGNNDWYISNVNIVLQGVDSGSGVKEIHYIVNGGAEHVVSGSSAGLVISTEGISSITYWVVDNAGNVGASKTDSGKIDKTAPNVMIISPSASDYAISENITIDFQVSDSGSGLLSSSASLDGATINKGQYVMFYNLTPGTHTLVVSASDIAGNSVNQSITFNIIVTSDSLSELVDILYSLGEIKNKGIATSLKKQIESGQINALLNHIDAQAGKQISTYGADLLKSAISAL